MNPSFLFSLLLRELKKPTFFIKSCLLSLLFILTALLFLNLKSYTSFLSADYPFFAKLNILFLITVGSFSAITFFDAVFLLVTAILFGVNMALVIEKIKILRKSSSLKLTFGVGIVSLAATGCASCGLSLASLVGLGGVIALLPFGGIELYTLSIILLVCILFYNLNSYAKICKIKPTSGK